MTNTIAAAEQLLSYNNDISETLRENHPISVTDLLNSVSDSGSLAMKILVDSYGSNMLWNDFYLVLKETAEYAVISKVVMKNESDNSIQLEWNLPDFPVRFNKEKLHLVVKTKEEDLTYYHYREHKLMEWGGDPMSFNLLV